MIALAHAGLNIERTAKSVDHTGKLDQQAIARGIRDTPSELLDLGVDQVYTMAPQGHVRAFFIGRDEPRIAGDVCRDDRCQPTRYTFRAHILLS